MKNTPHKQKLLRAKFLEDTIKHFNVNNRGVDKYHGRCSYKYGCAIGRHLSKEKCTILDSRTFNSISDRDNFNILPMWMKKLGKDFLASIQELHDIKSFWNDTGLSLRGQSKVKEIKGKFIK